MGYIEFDHRGTVDPTGTKDGKLACFDTTSCPHCQAVLLVKLNGLRKWVDTPHRCEACHKPLCPECARIMSITKACPGPLRERIERQWQGLRAKESLFYGMSK